MNLYEQTKPIIRGGKSWVKDTTVKGGGFWRKLTGKKKPIESTPTPVEPATLPIVQEKKESRLAKLGRNIRNLALYYGAASVGSAVGGMAIGVRLYMAQKEIAERMNNTRNNTGVGGGEGDTTPTRSSYLLPPSPTDNPSTDPTIDPIDPATKATSKKQNRPPAKP